MEVTGHEVELLHDPTGILEGERYEFFLNIEVPEEDELYSPNGIRARIIFSVVDNAMAIRHYEFIDRGTNEVLNFEMEDEELEVVTAYCREHFHEAE